MTAEKKPQVGKVDIKIPREVKNDFLDLCQSLGCSQAVGFTYLLRKYQESSTAQDYQEKEYQNSVETLHKINFLDRQLKMIQYQSSFLTKLLLQQVSPETDTDLSFSLVAQNTSVDQRMPALFNQIQAQVQDDLNHLYQAKGGRRKTTRTDYNYPQPQDLAQIRQEITDFDHKHTPKKKKDRYTITPNKFRKRSAADYSTQRNIGQQAAKLLQNIYSIDFCENELEVGHRQEEIVTYLRFLMKKDPTGLMPPREREMYQKVVLDHKLLDCLFDYTGRNDFANLNAIQKAYMEEVPKIIKENKYTLDNPGLG